MSDARWSLCALIFLAVLQVLNGLLDHLTERAHPFVLGSDVFVLLIALPIAALTVWRGLR